MSEVREIAQQALEVEDARRKQLRAEDAERRRKEGLEKDAATLDWVSRSVLAEWFPGVEWMLIDRHFPQHTAVVSPIDDDDLFLIITEGQSKVLVPSPHEVRVRTGKWLVGARSAASVAELGRILLSQTESEAVPDKPGATP